MPATSLPRLATAALGVVVAVSGVAAPAATASADPSRTNVILLIADGMGYNHVDVASLWQHGVAAYQDASGNVHLSGHGSDSRTSQVYQDFPVQIGHETGEVRSPAYADVAAWASPDNVTRNHPSLGRITVTDSSAAATALSTGTLTRSRHLGIDVNEQPLRNMVDVASDAGLATGLVSSAQLWTDTIAGFAVHTTDRDTQGVTDQLLHHDDLDVLMGTGHPEFNNDGTPKGSFWSRYLDRQEWDALRAGEPAAAGLPEWTLIDERLQFQDLAEGKTPERVLGLAQTDGTLFHDRPGDRQQPFAAPRADNVPRLEEMTTAALNTLSNASDEGFFLMAEAATVDHSGHAGQLGRTIEEMVAFNDTVEAVVEWVEAESSWEETSVVVTADHETGNLWGAGTVESGDFEPITGAAGELPAAEFADFTDGAPGDSNPHYHTLSLVPLFARGPAAPALEAAATGQDEVRGAYLRNIDIATVLHAHIEAPAPEPEPEPPFQRFGFFFKNDWTGGPADVAFQYGRPTDEVLVGDWDGDGRDTIMVRRGNVYHVNNALRGGPADHAFVYGHADDDVLVGDWDGDGTDTLAVRRGADYHVRNSLTPGWADMVLTYGRADDDVLVGDWDGNGHDTLAVRRGADYHVRNTLTPGWADMVFTYGRPADTAFAGDWNGNGRDTLAVQRGIDFHARNSLTAGPADEVMTYGRPGDEVYIGDWDGNGTDTPGLRRTSDGGS